MKMFCKFKNMFVVDTVFPKNRRHKVYTIIENTLHLHINGLWAKFSLVFSRLKKWYNSCILFLRKNVVIFQLYILFTTTTKVFWSERIHILIWRNQDSCKQKSHKQKLVIFTKSYKELLNNPNFFWIISMPNHPKTLISLSTETTYYLADQILCRYPYQLI